MNELVDETGEKQFTLRNYLRWMREEGMVETTREFVAAKNQSYVLVGQDYDREQVRARIERDIARRRVAASEQTVAALVALLANDGLSPKLICRDAELRRAHDQLALLRRAGYVTVTDFKTKRVRYWLTEDGKAAAAALREEAA